MGLSSFFLAAEHLLAAKLKVWIQAEKGWRTSSRLSCGMPRRTHRVVGWYDGKAEPNEPNESNKREKPVASEIHSAKILPSKTFRPLVSGSALLHIIPTCAGAKSYILRTVKVVRVVQEDAELEAAEYLSCLVDGHTGWAEGVSWWVEDPELDPGLVKRYTVALDWERLVPLGNVPSLRLLGFDRLIFTTFQLVDQGDKKPAWWMPSAPLIIPPKEVVSSPLLQDFAFTYVEADTILEKGVDGDDVRILRTPAEKASHLKSRQELLVRDFSYGKSLQFMKRLQTFAPSYQGWFCMEHTVVTIHTLTHNDERMHLLAYDLPEVLLHRSLLSASEAGPSSLSRFGA